MSRGCRRARCVAAPRSRPPEPTLISWVAVDAVCMCARARDGSGLDGSAARAAYHTPGARVRAQVLAISICAVLLGAILSLAATQYTGSRGRARCAVT